jgi:hypothetical protein
MPMALYNKLSRKPKQFLTITGMNPHQFHALPPRFTQAYGKQTRTAAQTESCSYRTEAATPGWWRRTVRELSA